MGNIISEKIKLIFGKLQDEESRNIFTHRLMYILNENGEHCSEFFKEKFMALEKTENYERSLSCLKRKINKSPNKIVLYGAGLYSGYITNMLAHYGLKADYYCDRDIKKQNTQIGCVAVKK